MPSNIYLDKNSPITKTQTCDLHHWFQEEKMQFVTFRLADSLPGSVTEQIKDVIQRFEIDHPKPWSDQEIRQYQKAIGNFNEDILDKGYGSCSLRQTHIRKIVVDSLHFWNHDKVEIEAYVIMPNHIHILLRPLGDETIEDILGRIKSYTARLINKETASSGALWQREIWARIIRNPAHFSKSVEYIRQNPKNLPPDSYTLYLKEAYR
ncbi:MAG: transposase [Muribaculaceae bacterium]|nr:transposase [Muribaculaceae bacterium]